MAEKKKTTKKLAVATKTAKKEVKKVSMRENAAKKRSAAVKPRRVRKAAKVATKPVGAIYSALNEEYHIFTPKKQNFFTKSRKITPGYFRNSYKELKQVTWTGRRETWRLVFAVFIFSILLGTFISILDFGLEKLLRKIIL